MSDQFGFFQSRTFVVKLYVSSNHGVFLQSPFIVRFFHSYTNKGRAIPLQYYFHRPQPIRIVPTVAKKGLEKLQIINLSFVYLQIIHI